MKHYLELVDVNGRDVFIAAEDISVIHNGGGSLSIITLQGGHAPITVKKTHHEVIKKMVELNVFQLAKFN